jgi:hypothetical protein
MDDNVALHQQECLVEWIKIELKARRSKSSWLEETAAMSFDDKKLETDGKTDKAAGNVQTQSAD